MTTVTLYGKPDCCLCDDARTLLEQLRGQRSFELVERDITRDEALHRRMFERIPVVAIDGEEAFEGVLDEAEMSRRLCDVPLE